MAVALAVVAIALVVGVIIASQMKPPGGADMSPASLDSFQITRAQEGHVVPFVSGTVRQTGNILWYGNLDSEEKTEDVGGKGGGSSDVTVGFKYYIDLWQAVCLGPAEIQSVYVNDRLKSLSDIGTYTQNDGYTDTFYPTQPGEYANKMKGVCHIFLNQYSLGLNATMVPTMHWIVKSESSSPLTYSNLTNGTNPAALIYDLLIAGGAVYDNFNFTQFQAAADYFNDKDYGLNIAFSKQKEVREHINDVLNYIDAGFDVDAEGKFILTPFDPQDSSSFTVSKDDFIKFQFTRRAWKDTYNDFRANYTDADQAYTTRTIRVKNPANKQMVGYTRQKTVDLTAFTDPLIASQRLWEIMQRYSYPEAQLSITLPYKYSTYPIGTVFTVNHEDYGISNAEFRIIKKNIGEIDNQEVQIVGTQMVEKSVDDHYTSPGGAQWTTPDNSPAAPGYQDFFELPYNSKYGQDKAFIMLCARAGIETSFITMVSYNAGVDYSTAMQSIQFSMRGTLDELYPNISTTYAIDDDVGILFTPYKEDPVFNTVSRTDLFTSNRFAILGTELVAFQTVEAEGANSIRLKGVIRGLLNTPVAAHGATSDIWITRLGDNVLTEVNASSFRVKMLPSNGSETVDASGVGSILVESVAKARKPLNITAAKGVRSGSTHTISWWPTTRLNQGAGVVDNEEQQDIDPMNFAGAFHVTSNQSHDEWVDDATEVVLTYAGVLTVYIVHVVDGVEGDQVALYIDSGDGTYYDPAGDY